MKKRMTDTRNFHETGKRIQEYVGVWHWVSTVKLPSAYDGLNLGTYEKMIQGYKGEWLDYQVRCETWVQALKQHEKAKEFALESERVSHTEV